MTDPAEFFNFMVGAACVSGAILGVCWTVWFISEDTPLDRKVYGRRYAIVWAIWAAIFGPFVLRIWLTALVA